MIRYFVLAHYGGTYIDLDDVCAHLATEPLTQTALSLPRAAIVA
jgi:mannosyltransferase OCH1-like enzyme